MTINKVCGSGLKAIALAAQAVQLGESETVVAGGMESMSNSPYLLPTNARTGFRLGDQKLVDSMIWDGLWDAYENFHMGNTGELVAEKMASPVKEQDQYALEPPRERFALVNPVFSSCKFFPSKSRRRREILW